jgi:hypothetical protein
MIPRRDFDRIATGIESRAVNIGLVLGSMSGDSNPELNKSSSSALQSLHLTKTSSVLNRWVQVLSSKGVVKPVL